MKKLFLIVFIGLTVQSANAQLAAWLTDRALIKTDLMDGLAGNAYNGEIEFRLTRHFSLSGGYYDGSRQYSQSAANGKYDGFEYETVGLPDKGIINNRYAFLSLRYYPNKIMKAPFGLYYGLSLGMGKADFQGEFSSYLFDNSLSPSYSLPIMTGPVVSYSYLGAPFLKIRGGIGYQRLLWQRFYYDAGFSIDYNQFSADNNQDATIISGLAGRYGLGIFDITNGNSTANVAFYIEAKIGYMLY